LLVVVVAGGLVIMHVAGNASTSHDGHAEVTLAAGHDMAAVPPSIGDASGCCTPAPAGPEGAFDPAAVCLAILTAVGLAAAVVLWLLRAARSRPAALRRPPAAQRWRGRGPPVSMPPLGRRIAALSVLRI
jgi:hypothetical protein